MMVYTLIQKLMVINLLLIILRNRNIFFNKNIQVIHIFGNEWHQKQDIVKSLILRESNLIQNKIDCTILQEISLQESNQFLEKNHIQGICESNKQLGLFYNQELVSVMALKDNEILRHGDKLNLKVIGSFERFLKEISGSVTMKIDRRFSNGNFLLEYGFKLIDIEQPNYFYTKNHFHNRLDTYDPNLTEWKNKQINGYDRIWDCGNLVFSNEI